MTETRATEASRTIRGVKAVGVVTCFWALISPQIVSGYDARPSLVLAVILASVSIAALAATFVRHTSGVRVVVAGLIAIDVVVVWHCAGLLGWRGP